MASDNEKFNLLVEQLQQGSELAFTRLYDQYSKQLYRNIFRLVKDEDIAKELLQDLFLKVWNIKDEIDPQKSFKSFLYKISENLVYMHFRKIAKDKRLIMQLIAMSVQFDNNAEEAMICQDDVKLLNKAIEKLSPQRKLIYTLCKLEGKSYEEVSSELGITTSTIRDHIVKANKTVKKYVYLNQDIAIILIASQFLKHLK